MDQANSIGSRIRGSASALMADCFSKVSPSAATSALASATGYDGKIHSPSTYSESSTSTSSSRMHSLRGLEDTKAVVRSGEQGFRTRPSQSGCVSWGEKWAFEIFTADLGLGSSYPDHASDSRQLPEESMNQSIPEGSLWSAQGNSRDSSSYGAYELSRSIDGSLYGPHELSDGAAVVALLSSPNFAMQNLEYGELDDETEHEQNRYKTPQFPPETDAGLGNPVTENPLHPLTKVNREASDVLGRGTCYPLTANISSNRTPSNPTSAPDIEQPWIGINNSYLFDVWDVFGFRLDNVYAEARVPHEDAGIPGQGCPATNRLTMIRKHIDYLDKW